ncbi:PREDICTED: uncharacterized protein LOC109163801 [Ipomoea nil]|uniref:uncharacterized protein LOC109163801 n=1 Tax=Ipomoea nil TaxID=35883 RepID=UPI0009015337|nr:PREDICTED: uncharacterized protein LOC109163801 [Ipomoea nil]
MNLRELVGSTADMNLEDDADGVRFEEEMFEGPAQPPMRTTWTLIGKFLTDRILKVEVMKRVMAAAWRPLMGIEITDVLPNLYLFTFFDEADMRRVLEEGPWAFENTTLICQILEDGVDPTQVVLNTVDFWIQVYDIPLGYRTVKVLERIGDFAGVFKRYDERNFERSWTSFYWIRITHDVTAPLKRRMKMIMRDGTWTWINFKYDRLHMFCFFCGIMGHTDKFCLAARRSLLTPDQYMFAATLRVGGNSPAKHIGDKWFKLGQERRKEIGFGMGGYGQNGGAVGREELTGLGGRAVEVGVTGKGGMGQSESAREREVAGEGEGVRVDPKRRRMDGEAGRGVVVGVGVESDGLSSVPSDDAGCGVGRGGEGVVEEDITMTDVNRDHAERLRVKLGFDGLLNVDNSGLSGGLALLWRANDTATVIGYSDNHIDVEVSMPGFDKWRMTGFYGFSKRPQRRESWDLIRSLAGKSDLPWVIIGDFNDLLYQCEKQGGNPHPDSLLRGFGEAIEECGLTQLPMSGYPFTWEKGKGTPNWIEERLDKVLATQDWRELVTDASVQNILTRKSDHSALFLGILNLRERRGGLRRGFRFEMAWLHDEGCRAVVEKSWDEGRGRGLQECVTLCGNRLTRWGGDRFHKFGEKILCLRKEQLRLRGCTDPVSLAEFQRLEECLTHVELQEDTYWRQRAKQHWLKDADANTRFYHRYASNRKKKNSIAKIMNDSGDWIEGDAMRNIILDYYRGIFKSSSPTINDEFFATIQPRVTPVQNEGLLRPFEVIEVKSALFSMYPDKAPGPDGMNPGFYQHFWDVVGTDVSSYIMNCLNTGSFPSKLNETNIILIPKKKNPEMVSDYRPIALSNVIYRIMAKVITARMKPLMENIISESQSAFISERLITDNILIAAEVGHYLNRKQCGLAGWGALKLNMAKAYDRMEWPFLESMLMALGFVDRWVRLLMMCVTTVSYNILINVSQIEQITPTRGLRQGDPLSPYLFIICAEGLSLLLQQAQAKGEIHGCRVARGAPSITHLFFADDSLLFFKANAQEAGVIKSCLKKYEKMSGQAVNYHKSSICYSKNTRDETRDEVANILGVVQAQNFGKYLGLPSFVGRNRRAAFAYIEDKIRQRISSWNKKLLSQAGKEVLLKSGIHWKAWDKLCIPKKYGGLGFKELRAFNLAMLGKQGWRFLTQPQSLVSRVYKARYYPTNSFYDACLGNNPSFCWRSILAAQELICGGVRRRTGNGQSTLIWDHPWLHDGLQPKILTEKPPQLAQAKVVGLMDQQTRTWDKDILTDIFIPEDIERILKIPVSPDYEDLWYWYGDPRGEYSVKNGYRTVVGEYSQQVVTFDKWQKLWKLKIPPRWKTFLWRALNDILPTTKNLLIKRVDIDPTCAMCGIEHEDVVHSLIKCTYTAAIWTQSHLPIPNNVINIFGDWFNDLMNVLDDDGIIYAVAILYYIWRTRNGAMWDAYLPRPRKVVVMAASALNAWKAVHHRTPTQSIHATMVDHTIAVTTGADVPIATALHTAATPIVTVHRPQLSTTYTAPMLFTA